MSSFHTTVTRRDFMKGLGLAGAGLGAGSTLAPLYHDLDEASSSPQGGWVRPWWVKQRELDNPTTELDWSMMQRMDGRNCTHVGHEVAKYVGADKVRALSADNTAKKNASVLAAGSGGLNSIREWSLSGIGHKQYGFYYSFILPNKIGTPIAAGATNGTVTLQQPPSSIGAPIWQGTPEENAQMMRSVFRFFGAAVVGFAEINPATTQKLFWTQSRGYCGSNYMDPGQWPPDVAASATKYIKFVDDDVASETATEYNIPNKAKYLISIGVPMSKEMFRIQASTAQGGFGQGSGMFNTANNSRYGRYAYIQACAQGFLRGIGYQGLGYSFAGDSHAFLPAGSDAVLGGLSEMGRNSQISISPEYGSVIGFYTMITDLPLAPTPPIDAGIFRFCHTCHRCADACPSGAINQDSQPSYDIGVYKGTGQSLSSVDPIGGPCAPGKKLFWADVISCQQYPKPWSCSICQGICTFNQNTASSVHSLVKSTISTTPVLNSFFFNMDKAFGFGLEPDPEAWWTRSLPVQGYDSTIGAGNGGYWSR